MVVDCLNKIDAELHHPVDGHTKRLLCASIELLLDYCVRFYERQFITRSNVNSDVLRRFERLRAFLPCAVSPRGYACRLTISAIW